MKSVARLSGIFSIYFLGAFGLSAQSPTFQYAVDFGNCDAGFFVVPASDSGFVTAGRNDNSSFFMRHDKNGAILWNKHIEQDPNQWYHTIEATNDGGYIALGLTNHLQKNYFQMAKLDSDGNLMWEDHYDVTDSGFNPSPRSYLGISGAGLEGMKCKQTSDSGYVVAGEVSVNSTHYYLLFRTDVSGNVLWSYAYDVGELIVSDMEISDKLGSQDWIVLSGTVYGDTNKVNLTCVDNYGALIWSNNYSLSSTSGGYAIDLTSDNGIVVTGHVFDSLSVNVNSSIAQDVMLMKVDMSGTPQFAFRYSFTGSTVEFGNSLSQTNDVGFLIGGTRMGGGALGMDSVNSFMLKTDLNGNLIWAMQYGIVGVREEIVTVAQGYDLNYLAVGYTDSDVYVVKANSVGYSGCEEEPITVNQTPLTPVFESVGVRSVVAVSAINIEFTTPQYSFTERYMCSDLTGLPGFSSGGLMMYPNPAHDNLYLESGNTDVIETVSVYSATGQLVSSVQEINSARVPVDVSEFTSGVYFLHVVTTNGVQSRMFIRN